MESVAGRLPAFLRVPLLKYPDLLPAPPASPMSAATGASGRAGNLDPETLGQFTDIEVCRVRSIQQSSDDLILFHLLKLIVAKSKHPLQIHLQQLLFIVHEAVRINSDKLLLQDFPDVEVETLQKVTFLYAEDPFQGGKIVRLA